MFREIKIFTDFGPGDGCKGSATHAEACRCESTSYFIKRGGAQGSHGVITSSGDKFNFSQWGCGTFEAIPTFLSEQMVVMPVGLLNEAEALKREGIIDPFQLLSCDPECICATPFHRISSRLEELLLGKNPRGTIGTGVGQAYRMWQQFGDQMTIRARELTNRYMVKCKLKKQLDYYRDRYEKVTTDSGLAEDADIFAECLDLLWDKGYLNYCVDLFDAVAKMLTIQELSTIIRDSNGTAVVECSHGVLTDAEAGLRPHVSAIRTLPKFTEQMLRDAGFGGLTSHYIVHRAYEIRHGAGPIPTYDPEFTKRMLPGSHKETNRWQGEVRAGALDVNLLRYALEACKGTHFDGVCLTCFDQILANKSWPICTRYQNSPDPSEDYIGFLERAVPGVTNMPFLAKPSKQSAFELADAVTRRFLNTPLYQLSVGPTERDKIFRRNR